MRRHVDVLVILKLEIQVRDLLRKGVAFRLQSRHYVRYTERFEVRPLLSALCESAETLGPQISSCRTKTSSFRC
jgi:hypothetical protein